MEGILFETYPTKKQHHFRNEGEVLTLLKIMGRRCKEVAYRISFKSRPDRHSDAVFVSEK